MSLGFQLQKDSQVYIRPSKRVRMIVIKTERTQIDFLSDFFAAIARVLGFVFSFESSHFSRDKGQGNILLPSCKLKHNNKQNRSLSIFPDSQHFILSLLPAL